MLKHLKALLILLLLVLLPAPPVTAEAQKSLPPAETADVPAEREEAALEFVRQHHAELTVLLDYLKEHEPRQYQSALRELARAQERLAQIRQRDPEQYELEVKAWQLRSRIQLLVARWMMERDDQLQQQIREALDEQLEVRSQLLRLERVKAVERLERLDAQLRRLDQNRSQIIERQLSALLDTGSRRAREGANAVKKAEQSRTLKARKTQQAKKPSKKKVRKK